MRRPRKPLRLYYWPLVDALANYAAGHAFALASSKEMAIKLIVDDRDRDLYGDDVTPFLDSEEEERRQAYKQALADELREKEPRVFATPVGYAMRGGE